MMEETTLMEVQDRVRHITSRWGLLRRRILRHVAFYGVQCLDCVAGVDCIIRDVETVIKEMYEMKCGDSAMGEAGVIGDPGSSPPD
jgi:hypothetical protein